MKSMTSCGRRIVLIAKSSSLSPPRRSDLAILRSRHLAQQIPLPDHFNIPPIIFKSIGGKKLLLKKVPRARIKAVGENSLGDSGHHERRTGRSEVLAAAAFTVALATGNRVFFKLALIPLRNYPFFLAQIATFGNYLAFLAQIAISRGAFLTFSGLALISLSLLSAQVKMPLSGSLGIWYVVVYFSILYCRYQAGIVTDKMLSLPKGPYIILGFLETIAAVSGMAATAVLPGPLIPILSQTFLVWQLILSSLILKRHYRFNQVVGCILVSVGVIITVMSGTGITFHGMEIFWTLLMINSFLFQAADTVTKEIIFENTAKKLKGRSIDIFVVNSYASAFQALFTCLLLPFLAKLWGIPLGQLPAYVKDGAACFLNVGSLSPGCEGAPLLPVLFVMVNMSFNISLLHLVKISSGVASCLASAFSVPLSIYVFTLPLPYAGTPSSLPTSFLAGAAILVSGLLVYSFTPPPLPQTGSV